MINFNKQLDKLGTETAFSVSAEANSWKDKGHKVYPFHLGDLNFQTPLNIREKTVFYMNKNKNGYCPSEGVPELRKALAKDVGEKRKTIYNMDNVIIQPGGKPTIWKFLASVMNPLGMRFYIQILVTRFMNLRLITRAAYQFHMDTIKQRMDLILI